MRESSLAWSELFLLAAVCAAAFAVGLRLARSGKRGFAAAVAFGMAGAAYRVVTHGLGLHPLLDPRIVDGLCAAAFLFPGALEVHSRGRRRERGLYLLLGSVLVLFILGGPFHRAAFGWKLRGLDGPRVGNVVMQSTGYSCAPAAAATVLDRYGIHATEGELAWESRTTFFGTSYPPVAHAIDRRIRGRGLRARVTRIDPATIGPDTLPAPAIVTIPYGTLRHAVVLLEWTDDDTARIGNPLDGTSSWSLNRLREVLFDEAIVVEAR